MVYGLYYCYSIDIQEFKQMPHFKQLKNQVSKHSNRAYKNNQNIRRKGRLHQPGGASCQQRR